MKKILLIILFIFAASIPSLAQKSQTLKGVVYSLSNGTREPLPFASVYWLESGTYMDCDDEGRFTFTTFNKLDATLVATAIGYSKDTINVSPDTRYVEFEVIGINELEKAVVQARQSSNFLSKTASVKTEVISAAGLCKMACCNLAESFENSASVSVGYSDAITGARQIRLLGLSGIYTEMLDENRPVMRGLASPFGLAYVPGQWLESIQVAKGPSSVINGLEAITGQINMEHRKPTDEKPFFANLYLSQDLMAEANVASSLQLDEHWSTVILAHASFMPKAHDMNGDGFMDEPLTQQYNFANRWLYYQQDGIQIRFGVKGVYEERIGGQVGQKGTIPPSEITQLDLWGSHIFNKHANAYLKIGIPLNSDNSNNIALVADYTYHDMDSWFGIKAYNGTQHSVFANLIFQSIPNDSHRISAGVREQFDYFNEYLLDSYITAGGYTSSTAVWNRVEKGYDLGRKENSIGVYGEYTYTLDDKLTAVADLSLDYNNLYGLLFAPRGNVKYTINDYFVFRASGGRGFRSPNVVVDNLGMLSTGRKILIGENLKMEDAWTYGGNLTAYIPIGFNDNAYLSFDYFRTDFNSQIIMDQEKDWTAVCLYNLDGRSFTNTYQADFSVEPIERFTVLATFRYTDAKVTLANKGLVERPLTSRYKGVLNLQYATRMSLWTFDFTAQVNGPARLPDFIGDGAEYSPVYPILFAQVTRKLKGFDVYIGGENLTNYRQKTPILEAQEPFGPGFNASCVWGPIMGIKVYAGMRFTLWKK